jgi:hypothetical protein
MSAVIPPALTAATLGRARALATLQALASGLPAGAEGASRLLERIAASEDCEALRAALVELGALAVVRREPQ